MYCNEWYDTTDYTWLMYLLYILTITRIYVTKIMYVCTD